MVPQLFRQAKKRAEEEASAKAAKEKEIAAAKEKAAAEAAAAEAQVCIWRYSSGLNSAYAEYATKLHSFVLDSSVG